MRFLKGIGYLMVVSLLVAASVRAKADTVSYDGSGSFSTGQQSSGVVENTSSEAARSYALSLTSKEALACDSKRMTDNPWSRERGRGRRHPVSMPEPPSIIELLLAGAFLLAGMSRARKLKAAARLD